MSFCVSECISNFPRKLNATYDIKLFLYKIAVNHHIKRIIILQPSIGEGFFFLPLVVYYRVFKIKFLIQTSFFLLKRFQMYLEAKCKWKIIANVWILRCSSEKQIMLLIHHLYARLADDIVIMSLLKEGEEHEGLQIAIEAIRREIEITKPKQRENATGSCHLGDPELPESDVSGALLVNNIRENFRKRKESTFRSKVDSEQSNDKMNEHRFYEMQRNTDEAIAKLKL